MSAAIAHRAELFSVLARGIHTRVRGDMADWIEQNVHIPPGRSNRPGRMRLDFRPYQRVVANWRSLWPHAKGLIAMKPSQVGFSTLALAIVLGEIVHEPGPVIYATTDKEKAGEFAGMDFDPMVQACADAAELFARGGPAGIDKANAKSFAGGAIFFVGAGGEGGMISRPARVVVLDEYELSSRMYREATKDDLWTSARERMKTFKGSSVMFAFGHPRYEDEDIDALWKDVGTRHRSSIVCPHCRERLILDWNLVCIRAADARDNDHHASTSGFDPERAYLACNRCHHEITDAERARELRHPEEGGSYAMFSERSAEEQARCEYVSVAVHGFEDHTTSIRQFARQLASCITDEAKLTFFNKVLGQPMSRSVGAVDVEAIRAATVHAGASKIRLQGGLLGARFIVTGADVQAPEANPTIYATAVAYTAAGMALVCDAKILSGFTAYHQWLRTLSVPIDGPDPRAIHTEGSMPAIAAGIDAKWATGQVLDSCRTPVYAAVGGRMVQHVPLSYQAHLNEHNPWVIPPEAKRMHPTKPNLGPLDHYYWLYRNFWVDRIMRRFTGKTIQLLCPTPDYFAEHITANVLRPKRDLHGLNADRMEWVKPDKFRDDWAQALAYAEAVAAIVMKVDQMYAQAQEPPKQAPPKEHRPGRWMSGDRSGWFGP